ncbi:hypothetical protein [Gellertiella hungarica]|uniref:Uncharacterized protein n=1 Tax=Gellertiella hungarica TaxID=1572859 RepID=A0A7W6J867_9HYPH|nr:hypothetical protein [Gellertiella hungarica]MBB4066569.1 hypothetical protein [Gellertiella hungarica]
MSDVSTNQSLETASAKCSCGQQRTGRSATRWAHEHARIVGHEVSVTVTYRVAAVAHEADQQHELVAVS